MNERITQRAERRENKKARRNATNKIKSIVCSIIAFIAIASTILFILTVDSMTLKQTYTYGFICLGVCIVALVIGYKKGILR